MRWSRGEQPWYSALWYFLCFPPYTISNHALPTIESITFLRIAVSQDLKRETNISTTPSSKPQQRMCFLRQLRKYDFPEELLSQFYTTLIESVLCTSITVWFGAPTKQDTNRLQQTIKTVGKKKITGAPLPTIQNSLQTIITDSSHPLHNSSPPKEPCIHPSIKFRSNPSNKSQG